jgi:hypothetical protein
MLASLVVLYDRNRRRGLGLLDSDVPLACCHCRRDRALLAAS